MTASQDATPPSRIIDRIKGLLLRPSLEWEAIAAEQTTVKSLFRRYALPLALIGPLATYCHEVIFEGDGLLEATLLFVGGYAASLLTAYVLGIVIDGMATTFGSPKNSLASMKLGVYAMTPYWLIGAVSLISPALAFGLTLTLGFYGAYLIYSGLTPLKQTMANKRLGYTASVSLIWIVLNAIIALLVLAGFSSFAVLGEAAVNILDQF